MQLRLLCAICSIGSWACGSVPNAIDGGPDAPTNAAPVDGAADSPTDIPLDASAVSPFTIITYGSAGPINTQLVAFQDGDGPWIALSGAGGVYTATLQTERYGVMTSCLYSTFGSGLSITYGAISDGNRLYLHDCTEDLAAAPVNISGNVMGAAPANPVELLTPVGNLDVLPGASTYSLTMAAGPATLIAKEVANARPVKLMKVDANVVDGTELSFDLAAGFAPVTKQLTASRNIARAQSGFRDIHGILSPIDDGPAPFNNFRYLPAERLGSGLNRLEVRATDDTRVIRYFKEPVDQHVTFPDAPPLLQQPTATTAPYPNVHFTILNRADGSAYSFSFSSMNPATGVGQGWNASMTSAWLEKASAGAPTFAYTMPDFRGLSGWNSGLQVEAGLPLSWSVELTKSKNVDWSLAVAPGALVDHDGSEIQLSSVSGELAAP